ncbi:Metallo-beta-lactamase superfamily protein [Saccharopolyspora antimicrobica]|uniref:Metallo-beta-lactamase superfamily protein n=1 Tax=Saccharopolyspora antimicrobica TaxID=455193 RepID=A0A1I5GQA9_9PSEU|nr:alkyl sulfatase dimerization domain-containing protein [Saccharopolyspora antimicrobica]RKT87410.1 metallo-beta-lactamase superfamily protein [Saccharopolyspora antimicrobica]SFO38123.1 Metallo-beta-lactamase superfamily protein [Saccharopolyspora antimicrobica]
MPDLSSRAVGVQAQRTSVDSRLGSGAHSLMQQNFGNIGNAQFQHVAAREVAAPNPPKVVEVAPRTFMIQPGMANVALFETDDGLLMVDSGCAGDGPALLHAVRQLSAQPLHTVVFTHGHVDHAFGLWAFLEAGERPRVVAHENLLDHFARYAKTAGLNAAINGQRPGANGRSWPSAPEDFVVPDVTFRDALELRIGGERFVVRHAKGETDDAAWVWAPQRRVIAAGDLVVGYLPNAGNPRKVQRYAEEWADAAEEMAALDADYVITGHGDCVEGAEAIRDELLTMVEYLRYIVRHALDGLNAGMRPDDIVESLVIPTRLAAHPRLQPRYDRPEFICRNVIRRYGGWWDGNPANLLPAPTALRAGEIARLAGGVDVLVARANELADSDLRLACHLAEWAFLADPRSSAVQDCYVAVFDRRRDGEQSLMGKLAFSEPSQRVNAQRAEEDR